MAIGFKSEVWNGGTVPRSLGRLRGIQRRERFHNGYIFRSGRVVRLCYYICPDNGNHRSPELHFEVLGLQLLKIGPRKSDRSGAIGQDYCGVLRSSVSRRRQGNLLVRLDSRRPSPCG